MERFYKTKDCPASQKLAALVDPINDGDLNEHLSECEFCAAELAFYRQYPPQEEQVEPVNIPQPLLELADALLHKRRDLSELYKLAGRGD
ncbi:MAG: hypothetical protein ABI481_03665 [Pyrinomonadaceae bacterium]